MLELTAFLCGAFVMVLEMIGARVLAPHVGTSAIVWTSLIGVVLACLALGAWLGGRFADARVSSRGLAGILLGAAVGCALTALGHQFMGRQITAWVGNLYAAAVLGAIAIFALPAFFFGMVTPYIIRLRLASVDTAGATVGRLYALSTTGSILGTFLGGFILVSFFSSSSILWFLSGAMVVLSLINVPQKPMPRVALLILLAVLGAQDRYHAAWVAERGGPMIVESPYNCINITEGVDTRRGSARVRLMSTNPGYLQSGMLIDDPDELYFEYTRFYALSSRYVPDAGNALMLGGGGYSIPKWLLSERHGFTGLPRVDVVELDPAMTAVAARVFGLPNDPRLGIYHEDARAFLNGLSRQYDLVFVDVFNSHYAIPFQMTTEEAMAAMRRAVAPGGALLMNVISALTGEDGRFARAIINGLKQRFADVHVYCVGDPASPGEVQNLMLVALPENGRALYPAARRPGMSPDAWEMDRMATHRYEGEIPVDEPLLSDDFAPVEKYAMMLLR